jgi:hypothetical protein
MALVLLVPVAVMVLMKVLGAGRPSGGKRAVDEVLIRHMMALAQQKRGREGGTGGAEALMRMVQQADPNAALAMQKVIVDAGSVGVEGEVEETRQGVVRLDAEL